MIGGLNFGLEPDYSAKQLWVGVYMRDLEETSNTGNRRTDMHERASKFADMAVASFNQTFYKTTE